MNNIPKLTNCKVEDFNKSLDTGSESDEYSFPEPFNEGAKWADIVEEEAINTPQECNESIPHNVEYTSINETKEYSKEPKHYKKRCFTCNPKGIVRKHIFDETELMIFNFDLLKRNILIITPKKHYQCINDIEAYELKSYFEDINTFSKKWNLNNYQLSYNTSNKKNNHFHFKFRAENDIIRKMKDDHFERLNYKKTNNSYHGHYPKWGRQNKN